MRDDNINNFYCIINGICLIIVCVSLLLVNNMEETNLNSNITTTETTLQETIKESTSPQSTTKVTTTLQEITKNETTNKILMDYINCDVPENNTIKSYMDYRHITLTTSKQYKLQNKLAHTNDKGLRMVGDRYCVALGSYYTTTIGQHVDIELENGKIIKGVLADCKDDIHTDSTNRINPNGSVVEFLVDTKTLDKTAKKMGDISYVNGWNSKVVNIRVYDIIEKF